MISFPFPLSTGETERSVINTTSLGRRIDRCQRVKNGGATGGVRFDIRVAPALESVAIGFKSKDTPH